MVASSQDIIDSNIGPTCTPMSSTASEHLTADQRESCVDFELGTPSTMESSERVDSMKLGINGILNNFSGTEMTSHFEPSCGELAPDRVANPQALDVVADHVDGFLDEFLYLAAASENENEQVDKLLVTDAELAWLQDPDAFMPTLTLADSYEANVGNGYVAAERVPVEDGKIEPKKDEAVEVEDATVLSSVGAVVEVHATVDRLASTTSASAACPITRDQSRARKDKARREKVARYLEKKKRRKWSRVVPYKSRQRVANARPRHKGRFLPLESEFVPIAELQRRQRVLFRQQQERQQQHVTFMTASSSTA